MTDDDFKKSLATAINCASRENGSNTPDFILAAFLADCLKAFDAASRERERWYGKSLSINAAPKPTEPAPQWVESFTGKRIGRVEPAPLPEDDRQLVSLHQQLVDARAALAQMTAARDAEADRVKGHGETINRLTAERDETRARLEIACARLPELAAERDELQQAHDLLIAVADRAANDLAASQAREAHWAQYHADQFIPCDLCRAALAQSADSTALREFGRKLLAAAAPNTTQAEDEATLEAALKGAT